VRVKDRWHAAVESAPCLDALLASVLADLMQQRLRIGLGRNYRTDASLIRGVRGRVDFTASVTRLALQHGQTYCRYQTFSPNVPANQIVRSTLALLAQVGEFGETIHANRLRQRMRRLVRQLDMVDLIELKPELIRRQRLIRHDADYRMMLAICYLICERQIPTQSRGNESLPALDRDAMTLYRVFEKFVANFYRLHLAGWTVKPQEVFHWPATKASYLPVLNPDLVVRCIASGSIVILDTKFTAKVLTTGLWGKLTFNRDHLFQIYAYLRSQEEQSRYHQSATGVLLYPTVQHAVSETIEIQGHRICWETVDLSRPWKEIEGRLLEVFRRLERGDDRGDPVSSSQVTDSPASAARR
jgi:5-methylcytosine-specific restriction enzyme subunit McrC